MKKKVLIIVGPTAVGKTDTAIHLAKTLNGEIISADSMQIYRHMQIGTAKPTLEEQEGVPHHLMDCVNPDESFTVADFQSRAMAAVQEITDRGKLPIVAGGTGLYVNSLLYEMDFTASEGNWELRKQLEREVQEQGKEALYEKLRALDPDAAARIHPNNVKRVIRALEVNLETGERMGDFRRDIRLNSNLNFFMIGLTRDRQELYDRINLRVELMLQAGLVEEVRSLLTAGYREDLVAFKGLGYKEIISYLKGGSTYEEAIDLLKKETRHYAKRQLTWFNRYDFCRWYNLTNYEEKFKLFQEILEAVEGHFNFVSNS